MIAAILLLAASGMASAQTRRESVGWISFFTGAGGVSGAAPAIDFIGDDVTFRLYKGFGAGIGEGVGRDFGANNGNFVLFPMNLSYHFRRLDRLGPFVTGGYSMIFRRGIREDGANFGAGLQYWFRDHFGLDAEFRNHVFAGAPRYFGEFRIGFAMR
jgi:hypothetical protein